MSDELVNEGDIPIKMGDVWRANGDRVEIINRSVDRFGDYLHVRLIEVPFGLEEKRGQVYRIPEALFRALYSPTDPTVLASTREKLKAPEEPRPNEDLDMRHYTGEFTARVVGKEIDNFVAILARDPKRIHIREDQAARLVDSNTYLFGIPLVIENRETTMNREAAESTEDALGRVWSEIGMLHARLNGVEHSLKRLNDYVYEEDE